MTGPLVVVGDALLDIDLDGTAERLTPDGTVPVLDDLHETARPGGAGLAALMAAREDRPVVLVSAIGDDEAGERLTGLLDDAGVRVCRLPYDGPTPVKQRVRACGQPVLRLDSGSTPGRLRGMTAPAREALLEAGSMLVADYGRGVAADEEVRDAVGRAGRRAPRTWDPHLRGAAPLPGTTLVTPNEREALRLGEHADASRAGRRGGRLARVGRVADGLVESWRVQAVAVTLGADGALLSFGHGTPVVVPAPVSQAPDPCGAGDRFAVSAALALGEGRVASEAVQEAVHNASSYVAAGGPASLLRAPTPSPRGRSAPEVAAAVRRSGGTVVATGGCFDLLHAGHVATLHAARRLGDCLVVCVNSDKSVRRLKGPTRPLVPVADRVQVLEALDCIDAVAVFDEDTPVRVIEALRPDVWAKGGDYAGTDVPEAEVLGRWGGQVVALPYLQGRSTTALVESASLALQRGADEEES